MEIFLLFIIIGLLIYIVSDNKSRFLNLEDRIYELSKRISELKTERTTSEKPVTPDVKPQFKPEIKPDIPVVPKPPEVKPISVAPEPFPVHADKKPSIVTEKPHIVEAPVYVPQKSWWESFKEKNPDLEKFIGENIINKIGVLILVLGISYLVKFAIDKNWINEPARVGIGILCGGILIGFAHKLRKNYAAFSSVLVAGAISIFYFTIAIAFHDYGLFSQTAAFAIMIVITGFSAFISMSYNRLELAVLSLIGGFAVPFMVSSGEGNYIVLFTYIAILDIGILALAYYKKWGLINILSYIFTVVLFGGWLFQDLDLQHPHYLGTFVFAFLFYIIFILINIINNLKTKGSFTATELSILASNSFLFYAAGMIILSGFHPEWSGIFTTLLGLLNFSYAWFLYKKFGLDKNAVYLLIGLTLTFITLAVPIQFKGNYITLFWAAEGIILIWLAQKSNISFYRFVSAIVHTLMLISIVMDFQNIYQSQMILDVIFNPGFMTAVFAVISLLAVSRLLQHETETFRLFGISFNSVNYRKYCITIAIILAYCSGFIEAIYQSNDYIETSATAGAIPVVYHLLMGAILVHFIPKTDNNRKLATLLAMTNIVLFTFLFSKFAFNEHADYVATGTSSRLAFYLHYVSLFLTIYFGFAIYKMNAEKPVFNFVGSRKFIFITAFLLVYIASTEVMLHGLVFSNDPVTIGEINNEVNAVAQFEDPQNDYIKSYLADDKISFVRNQIIKTGYPILWGALAFAFLIAGIRRKWKSLRIFALILLGITILKLFIFDIRNASETGKIIAFILLGVLILIISFVYQKLKILVIDEKTETEPIKPENNETV